VAFIEHDPVNRQATVPTFKAIYGAPFRRNERTLKKISRWSASLRPAAVVRKIAPEQETIVPPICCNRLGSVLALTDDSGMSALAPLLGDERIYYAKRRETGKE